MSKHLKVLREAGLVESRTDAQRRIYRVMAQPLREVDEWLAPYRRQWAGHLNALERHLEMMDGRRGLDVSGTDAGAAGTEFGTLERTGDVSVLRYERRLAQSRERVWRALTDDAERDLVPHDH